MSISPTTEQSILDDAWADHPSVEAREAEPEAAPTLEPPKPPEASDAERKLGNIIKANAQVLELHANHLETAETAKHAKKAWEAAAESLQLMIARLAEKLPLFDRDPPAETSKSDEPWRETHVDVLTNHGLSPAIVAALVEAELGTIGAIADWTATDKKLTDIPRIGAAKAEKIEAALDLFWAAQVNAWADTAEKVDADQGRITWVD